MSPAQRIVAFISLLRPADTYDLRALQRLQDFSKEISFVENSCSIQERL